MLVNDLSYDLGIESACSDIYTGASIDTSKITLLGYPVIPDRHKARRPYLAIDEVSFWEGYNNEIKARKVNYETI